MHLIESPPRKFTELRERDFQRYEMEKRFLEEQRLRHIKVDKIKNKFIKKKSRTTSRGRPSRRGWRLSRLVRPIERSLQMSLDLVT